MLERLVRPLPSLGVDYAAFVSVPKAQVVAHLLDDRIGKQKLAVAKPPAAVHQKVQVAPPISTGDIATLLTVRSEVLSDTRLSKE